RDDFLSASGRTLSVARPIEISVSRISTSRLSSPNFTRSLIIPASKGCAEGPAMGPVSLLTSTLPRPKALKSAQEPLLDGLPAVGLGPGRFAGLDHLLLVILGVVRDFGLLPRRLPAAQAFEDDGRLVGHQHAAFLAFAAVLQMRLLLVHPAAGDPFLDADLQLLGDGHA